MQNEKYAPLNTYFKHISLKTKYLAVNEFTSEGRDNYPK